MLDHERVTKIAFIRMYDRQWSCEATGLYAYTVTFWRSEGKTPNYDSVSGKNPREVTQRERPLAPDPRRGQFDQSTLSLIVF